MIEYDKLYTPTEKQVEAHIARMVLSGNGGKDC